MNKPSIHPFQKPVTFHLVHIDDEYEDFIFNVNVLMDCLETYFEEATESGTLDAKNFKGLYIANTEPIEGQSESPSLTYKLTTKHEDGREMSGIDVQCHFFRTASAAKDLSDKITGISESNVFFILDAIKKKKEDGIITQKNKLEDNFKVVKRWVASDQSNAVIFSAYGSSIEGQDTYGLEVIDKTRVEDLHDKIANFLKNILDQARR